MGIHCSTRTNQTFVLVLVLVTVGFNFSSAPRFDHMVSSGLNEVPGSMMSNRSWSDQVYRSQYWWMVDSFGPFDIEAFPEVASSAGGVKEFYLVPQPRSLVPDGNVLVLSPRVADEFVVLEMAVLQPFRQTLPNAEIRCLLRESRQNVACRFTVFADPSSSEQMVFVPVELGARHVALIEANLLRRLASQEHSI